jgi:uncharacterized protein YceK
MGRNLVFLVAVMLSGCATVKEKSAPCKRPAELASYAGDPRRECGGMRAVNDPAFVFAAIGIEDLD